jgi:hypothetical protein
MLFVLEPKGLKRKAQLARRQFALHGPPDAPPLPIGYNERESIKGTSPLATIVSRYARSWQCCRYDIEQHPSFYDYACGVMASEFNGWPGLATDPEMLRRFPPRKLAGLGPGLMWEPPKARVEESRLIDHSHVRTKRLEGYPKCQS